MKHEVVSMEPLAIPGIKTALLTGGGDRPYAFGLATALMAKGVYLDIIAGDGLTDPTFDNTTKVTFLNLRGNQEPFAGPLAKAGRVLIYYGRLIRYAWTAQPKVFHILWNNKFETVDRSVLMGYYRLLGKKIILTVHNVNAARRDSNDTALNRITLKMQYRLADHLFVHTDKMKGELINDFGVQDSAITVIPFGINNAIRATSLTPAEAKQRLGIMNERKTILFFGNIAPYKGLEYLVAAFRRLVNEYDDYCLIIAGRPKGTEQYWDGIQRTLRGIDRGQVVQRIEYIPDEDTELYFKAADVLVLPYTEIFQSGVLFLGYSFGLPVVAADVGSLRADVVDGKTGFVCKPRDSVALARAIETYFSSDLFRGLASRRQEIRDYANERYSWDTVGQMTRNVYMELLGTRPSRQGSRVAT
jgi:glycosyltransferase involved in cell wall biosynthesis